MCLEFATFDWANYRLWAGIRRRANLNFLNELENDRAFGRLPKGVSRTDACQWRGHDLRHLTSLSIHRFLKWFISRWKEPIDIVRDLPEPRSGFWIFSGWSTIQELPG